MERRTHPSLPEFSSSFLSASSFWGDLDLLSELGLDGITIEIQVRGATRNW